MIAYGGDPASKVAYIAMEFCEAGNLRDFMGRNGGHIRQHIELLVKDLGEYILHAETYGLHAVWVLPFGSRLLGPAVWVPDVRVPEKFAS